MPKNRIHIDQAALERAAAPGIARMAEQKNETMRATIREVNSEMRGRPKPEVVTVMMDRLRAALPGASWNIGELEKYADAISNGTLED